MTKVKTDLKGLTRQITNLMNLPMDKISLRTLELNFDQIEKKTNNDGSKFKPYTPEYAEQKGTGTGNVDLVSRANNNRGSDKPYGTMLKSFSLLTASKRKAVIGFRGEFEKAKAGGNVTGKYGGRKTDKARPFVGLTEKNKRKLYKFVYKLLSKKTY